MSSPTPRNLSPYGYSSAYTHQQGVLGLPVTPMYSRSPSTDPESDSVTNTHTQRHSFRPSTAGSQTYSIVTSPPPGPGPSGAAITSGHPPEHQWMSVSTSAGAGAKAREARMERQTSIPDGRLRAVNMTEEVDPVPPPPPPAYSREAQ
jgi:hypothetical protein